MKSNPNIPILCIKNHFLDKKQLFTFAKKCFSKFEKRKIQAFKEVICFEPFEFLGNKVSANI